MYCYRNCVESLYELELNMSLTHSEVCSVDFSDGWSHSAKFSWKGLLRNPNVNSGIQKLPGTSMILNQEGRCSLHLCKGRHSFSFLHRSLWNRTINTSLLCCVLVFKSPQWFEEDKALPWDFLVQFWGDLAENPGYLIVWLFSLVY